MFGLTATTEFDSRRVKAASDRGSFKNLGHAAATIRKEAVASIEVSPEPSDPGTPPHTKKRQLKRAIRFDVDKARQLAVIGPRESMVGESAAAHEHGGDFKGQDYDQRAFMFPALEANLDRVGDEWKGTIGE